MIIATSINPFILLYILIRTRFQLEMDLLPLIATSAIAYVALARLD